MSRTKRLYARVATADAWDTIVETLETDANSSAFDKSLRSEIGDALDSLQPLSLPALHAAKLVHEAKSIMSDDDIDPIAVRHWLDKAENTDGIDPFVTIDALVDILDGTEHNADTTAQIVDILRNAGYTINDVQ